MTNLISELPDTHTCLCGSELNYAECCGKFHRGAHAPATAEALMRSRFTAYAMRNVDYLQSSWDKSKRPTVIDFSKETAEWQKLQIINVKKGGPQDSKGIVEFKAFYCQDGDDYFLHEISRFVKTDQNWLYFDGLIKAAGKVAKNASSGKNAPCACGSGKKFKRCCGAS